MTDYDNTVQTGADTLPADSLPPVRTRRVGTFTMGAALIVIGIFLFVSLFTTAFSIQLIGKLSPLILVFLGIEILIQNFLNKGDKIKYDFLSGLVCFLLICGSMVAYAIPYAIAFYGPERDQLESRLSDEAYDTCYDMLATEDIISMHTPVYLHPQDYDKNLSLINLKGNGEIYAHLTLPNSFDTTAEFAESCKGITDKLLSTGLPFDQISFEETNTAGSKGYSLHLDDRFQYNLTAEKMETIVEQYNVYTE